MTSRFRWALPAVVAGLLPLGAAWAAEPGGDFAGTWIWNAAQSRDPEMDASTAPKSITLVVSEATATTWHSDYTITDQKGQTLTYPVTAPNDGLYHAITGTPDHQEVRVFREGQVEKLIFHADDGTEDLSCSLSSDARKMTCLGLHVTKAGKRSESSTVWDRKS